MNKLICSTVIFAALVFSQSGHAANELVTNTNNGGPGSLRQAILNAESDGVATTILFDGAVFPAAINLTTRLPRIVAETDTTIDGSGLGVVLSGDALPDNADQQGLRIRASNTVVRGLIFRNFPGDAIRVQPDGDGQTVTGVLIENNTIFSQDAFAPGTGSDAIGVRGGTTGNTVEVTIKGNNVKRSTDDGILVRGSLPNPANGGNTVTATIDGNQVQNLLGGTNPGLTGDGIRAVSGCGDSGTPNTVTAIITNNIVYKAADQGILVKGAGCGNGISNNNILNATISGNTVRLSGQGVDLGLPTSQGIGVTGGDRSGVTGGTNNTVIYTVSNNTVSGSTGHGITISGGGSDVTVGAGSHDVMGTVSGNIVVNNGERGINISGGRSDSNDVQTTISGNRVKANGEGGIIAVMGSGVGNDVNISGISNNLAVNNTGDGIRIASGVDGDGLNAISGNNASRNSEDGIDINSTGYTLSNNTANKNGGDGINAVAGNTDGLGNSGKGNGGTNVSIP